MKGLALRFHSIKSRMLLAVGIMTLCALLGAAGGYVGLGVLENLRAQARGIDGVHASALALDGDVQELRRRVAVYVMSGQRSQRVEIERVLSDLTDRVEGLAALSIDSSLQAPLEGMRQRLEQVKVLFSKVAEEREVRESLLASDLPSTRARVIQAVAAMRESTLEEGDETAVARFETEFTAATQWLFEYLTDPDGTKYERMLAACHAATATCENVSDAAREEARVTMDAVQDFERIATRLVQATRGYSYLVNVVMTGDATEFEFLAKRFKQRAVSLREALARDTERNASRISMVTVIGLVGTVLVAWGIVALFFVLAVRPVGAITKTFKNLAGGIPVDSIPGSDRADEIGELAMAAAVFREKNAETEKLLETTRVLAESQRRQAEELRRSNEELDRFAYVASHDLRSPLSGIASLTEWIFEDAGDRLPEKSRDYLSKMQVRVKKLEDLLEGLLEYSRVGRVEESTEDVDLDRMLSEIVALLDNPEGVRVEVSTTGAEIVTARLPLEQVLLNLLTNAIKHHDKGSGGFVRVEMEMDGEEAVFHVSDNGPGVHPRQHERIFQMYQRAGDGSVKGSGMGLAIVKKHVEARGGTIEIDSEEGQGATFRFRWPVSAAEAP